MGPLRNRGPAPKYADIREDEDACDSSGSDGEQPAPAARRAPPAKPSQALSRKRAKGNDNGGPASRRRRSSPTASSRSGSESESGGSEVEDPIESADEDTAGGEPADAYFQVVAEEDEDEGAFEEEEKKAEDSEEEQQRSGESGWDEQDEDDEDDEDDEEETELLRQRRPSRPRRSLRQRQAEEEGEEEEEEDTCERRGGTSRLRGAAKPSYREAGSDEDDEEDESSEEEQQPRRQQPSKRQPATRSGGNRQPKQPAGTRQSSRDRQRVCYNEDALAEEFEESSEEEESSEGEESNDENMGQPARPTRHAAKAAGRAIRKQAGGVKRRKNPKRAAAPAKRRQMVVASSDDEDEGSRSGSESAQGSEEDQGSDDSASGTDSDGAGLDYERLKVEKLLESRAAADGSGEEFLCKFEGKSYRKTCWLPYDVLAVDRLQLVRNFQKRKAAGEVDPYGDLVEGVHPDWLQVDRVIAQRSRLGRHSFLVKWRGLGYAESTWETERDMQGEEVHIERYERYNTLAEDEGKEEEEVKELETTLVPDFRNGRQLRDYQILSLEWMVLNWSQGRNCILGDEMGLGKTAQSISVLAYQKQFGGCRGPFLVIAPLTTLGHWQREIETWTDMNVVVYAGGAADREVIQRHDFFFSSTDGNGCRRRARTLKPNVVLSSYETVLKDRGLFTGICWQSVIIDEAHRMKSTASSTRAVIAAMDIQWLLLLTGTPVQNNMRELFGILNLLDPTRFADEGDFLEQFGDERTGMTPEQVKALQEELRPVLLRRMKEDVETLPEKEEVIIWVELTPEQRAYYKAIYENQIGTLLAGASSKNMPNLRNLAMELRKVCCHPFLCTGLEEDIQRRKLEAGAEPISELDQLVQASGKMVLLHKLLHKLRNEGHKVLIFSQFKIMLDVLEDYLKLGGHPFERIDGSTSSRDRQAAIDRFSKEDSDSFVFLLSTRAGGQGITLTAADTCIIFDSDWNPQNDLQAMARCHRIGQDKEVTIYRLVSKSSYEENIFHMSSRKYGLDEAILGNLGASDSSGAGGNPEDDSRKIAELLKHGAHWLHNLDAANEQGGAFASEGIDEILQGRTEKRQIGGRAGNTFSVATFAVGGSTAGGTASGDDKSYWASLLPEAVQGHNAVEAARRAPVILAPRRRKQVDYKGQMAGRHPSRDNPQDDDDFVMDGSADAEDDDDLMLPKGKKQKKGKADEGPAVKRWRNEELAAFQQSLVQFGAGRAADVKLEANLHERSVEECAELEAGMLRALRHIAPLAERHEREVAAQRREQQQRHQIQQQPAAAGNLPGSGAIAGGSTAVAGVATVASGEAGAGGKVKGHKRPKDSSVQEALLAWVEEEMQKAPPAVAQALRTKQFLDWAAHHAPKSVVHLGQCAALSKWISPAGANELSPGGSDMARPLPFLRVKFPAYWWRDSDTRLLLEAVHALGWLARKGNAQSEILNKILTDERFGFHKRVKLRMAPPAPATTAAEQRQPAAAAGAPENPALAAGASVVEEPAWPKLVSQEDWKVLQKRLPDFIGALLQALVQPQPAPPKHGFSGGKASVAPAGGVQRPGAVQGGSARPEPAASTAAAAATAAGAGKPGVGPASDITPPHGSTANGPGAAIATAYTNPLTSRGGCANGSSEKMPAVAAAAAKAGSGSKAGGGSARKPQLPLHPSTGPKAKGKGTQQSIMGFFAKKQAIAAAAAAGAGPSQPAGGDSPGHKENQPATAGGSSRREEAGDEVIVVD